MSEMKRLKVVGCAVFEDELRAVAQETPNEIDVELLDAGLHAAPDRLRLRAQEAIDRAARSGRYDAVCLAYGLCGRGIVGLIAREIPVVIPRAHDCITLFLGSLRAYREQFAQHPGTFYFTTGWYKHKAHPEQTKAAAAHRFDPTRHAHYAEFCGQYGKANARYIIEFMESWRRNYSRAALIDHGYATDEQAEATRAVADAAGWSYERLPGSMALLEGLVSGDWDEARFLVVGPGCKVIATNDERIVDAVPSAESAGASVFGELNQVFTYGESVESAREGLALGIDAGGTCTDAVLYDLASGRVLCKAKSLTTHDDLSRGIDGALDGLHAGLFPRITTVCLSTTLATNAVVEGRGQPVGLLLMPYHEAMAARVKTPLFGCLAARMDIHGVPDRSVDVAEVVGVAEKLLEGGARSFAVSGYASVRNPAHELEVKRVLLERFGLPVVCGHELSQRLNFVARAHTAVLNARLVPLAEELLDSVDAVLSRRGVRAPVFVVRGDGSVMRKEVARQRAIECVLSGPAASAAGGRFLTGQTDALVVDMGGTTTDIALLSDGRLELNPDGAEVGRWRTSVAAADIQTTGLGGDSTVRPAGAGRLDVGPGRSIPLSLLAAEWPAVGDELARLLGMVERQEVAFDLCDFFVLVRGPEPGSLGEQEERIVKLLSERPRSHLELSEACGCLAPQFLRIRRLQTVGLVRRSSVTPTDALHVLGAYTDYDVAAARAGCRILGAFVGLAEDDAARLIVRETERRLALAIMRREMAADGMPDGPERFGPLLDVVLADRADGAGFNLRWEQQRPVVGIGAPVGAFLPGACGLLRAQPCVPTDADVANAVGAATSKVVVTARVHVRPGEMGDYVVHAPNERLEFAALTQAEEAAREHLVELIREKARGFGTEQQQVHVEVSRHVAALQDGSAQLVEVEVSGYLSGAPVV